MDNYSFGKTLKELRHGKGITQSRLAELLMVSPQAISKWENNIGYPDLTLLAPLSDIFGVTIDYLLGKDENTKAADIQNAKEKTNALWREERDTDAECIAIWSELLKKYPTDNECRNALAFELRANKDLPDKEKSERRKEAVELYETVLDESTDSEHRSFALSELVWLYNEMGETELAVSHAKKAGSAHCTTPHLMTQITRSPERKHWQQYEVFYMTCGLAWAIADQKYESNKDAIFAYRTALKIIEIVCYNKPYAYFDSYFSAYFLRCICEERAESGDFHDDIFEDIRAMLCSAKRADEKPLGRTYFEGNMFMDSVFFESTLNDTQMAFAKASLDKPIFDPIRADFRFAELYQML